MLHKSCTLIESKADAETGVFEATVAVFGNVDSVGDRIIPGAFTKTLDRWRQSGDPIPVILSHDWNNPFAHIGVIDPGDVQQTPKGLRVTGRLDIADNEVARQVHRLMQRRSLREFSFGYRVPQGGQRRGKDGANELTEIDLVEAGPTLKGANPATELHAVKSALGLPVDEDLRDESKRLEREVLDAAASDVAPPPDAEPANQFAVTLGKVDPRGAPHDIAATLDAAPLADGTVLYARAVTIDEHAGVTDGHIKAVWTTRYVNDLPDSAFLLIQSGGSKDSEGKTVPRTLRHFPVRDASGAIDLPHLRNALARIPQAQFLSQEEKDRLTARARRMLDNAKSIDPAQAGSVDALRKRSDELALEVASDGLSRRKPPHQAPSPAANPVDLDELRRRSRDLMFEVLNAPLEN